MALLEVRDLKTYFFMTKGVVKAVDGVSFEIERGETFGLAGESGCGKTTTAYSIMRLVPYPGRVVEGSITFDGTDILSMSEEEFRKIRWKRISMIFQGAMNALNPVFRIGDQIAEAMIIHNKNITKEEAMKRVRELFEAVGLDPSRVNCYPHEFSGGMRQRAMIAMALVNNPDLVIADEPTTALDVTIQAQILQLLLDLKRKYKMSLMLITHDLSIIAEISDKVGIMYAGKLVECGDVITIFGKPIHPYTKGLIEAIPSMERGREKTLFSIPGNPPDLINPPSGCRFHPRCPYAQEICKEREPDYLEIKKGHYVACHFADELKKVSAREFWSKYAEEVTVIE